MQIIINIIIHSCILILLAFSFRIIYQCVRFVHLAHAIVITLGAYLSFLFTAQLDFPIVVSIPLSIIFTTLISLLIAHFIYKPLEKKQVENWQKLIVSLGIYYVLQNLISILFGDNIKSLRHWNTQSVYSILNANITDIQIITLFACFFLLVLSLWFIRNTNIGKQIKAVSSNPGLSEIFGVSKNKSILYSFIIGSSLASIAGILIASDIGLTPRMGFNWLLYAMVAMIIGGIGKFRYLVLGAILLATAQHLSAYFIDIKWMNATAYVILTTFLFFKPYGFSGKKFKKAEL